MANRKPSADNRNTVQRTFRKSSSDGHRFQTTDNHSKQSKTNGDTSWRELYMDKDQFQEVVRHLVDFDERTGRSSHYRELDTHFMRKCVAVTDPSRMRIILRHTGGFIYHMGVDLENSCGRILTYWIHEDAVKAEKIEEQNDPEHPVHLIPCITELYENSAKVLPADFWHETMDYFAMVTEKLEAS